MVFAAAHAEFFEYGPHALSKTAHLYKSGPHRKQQSHTYQQDYKYIIRQIEVDLLYNTQQHVHLFSPLILFFQCPSPGLNT